MGLIATDVPLNWQVKRFLKNEVVHRLRHAVEKADGRLFRWEIRLHTPRTEAEIAETSKFLDELFRVDENAPPPPPRPEGPQQFGYNGRAYIRPVGRGVVLEELGENGVYIEEALEDLNGGDGYGHLDLEVTWTPVPCHNAGDQEALATAGGE